MINIKTPSEIAIMREGGRILAKILHELALIAKIGATTEKLNVRAEALMASLSVSPSFKGYRGYPAAICTAVNEEVVHAIPGKRILKNGDIISIDCGIIWKGLHTDSAVTIMLGNVKPDVKKFVKTVQKALEIALLAAKPGNRIGDISAAIQNFIESNGYSAVKEFVGHGIGHSLHEEPEIPNIGKKGKGPLLVPGMTFAIEPIITMGSRFIDIASDGWTAVTRDKKEACQLEHTILITPLGNEVLTKYNNTINNVYTQ